MVTTPGITEGAPTTCWDLIEVNNGSNKERRVELCSTQSEPQEDRGWEESSLAMFNNFLGFSIKGLEKDILYFFIKIRKIRERIHNKGLLEKSKFERELKRLECSINYEGEEGTKMPHAEKSMSAHGSPMKIRLLSWNVCGANDSSKRKVIKALIRDQRVDLFYL